MHASTVLAGVVTAALLPTAAFAQKPPKPPKPAPAPAPAPAPGPSGSALSIDATPNPVVFTKAVTITGDLAGGQKSSVVVRLEQDDTRPFGDSYKAAGKTTTTEKNGKYRFAVKPQRNTQYRAVAQTSPLVTSPGRLVNVRPLVGLKVSTATPRARSLVRFSGIVLPARNGARVLVQRQGSSGRFTTVARATLRAGSPGSVYAVRTRVRSSGTYRVKLAGNSLFVNGFSRSVALTTR